MAFKFGKLEVWQLSLEYVDKIYETVELLPPKEQFNLKAQMMKSVTSISLNIAEGSTGQTNMEFRRFLGIAVRSGVEVIACLHLAKRKGYINDKVFRPAYDFGERLLIKLQALRNKLK
jgi:four helix bundle protein